MLTARRLRERAEAEGFAGPPAVVTLTDNEVLQERFRAKQESAKAGQSIATAATTTTPTESALHAHEAALAELKTRHAEELERQRSETAASYTGEIDRLKARIEELEEENLELQLKLEALAKQSQSLKGSGAVPAPSETTPGDVDKPSSASSPVEQAPVVATASAPAPTQSTLEPKPVFANSPAPSGNQRRNR